MELKVVDHDAGRAGQGGSKSWSRAEQGKWYPSGGEQGRGAACISGAGLPTMLTKTKGSTATSMWTLETYYVPLARVQMQDSQGPLIMVRAKKLIVDCKTWSCCFDLLLVAVWKDLDEYEDLLAYRFHVADTCARFGWPTWGSLR